MNSYFLQYFISSAAIAGIAVIWRNWIIDHPAAKKIISDTLGTIGKAVLCGSCFTYWLALAFTLAASPLSFWVPFSANIGIAGTIGFLGNIFFQWMALAWFSVFLRFVYVAVQELVHYQMHHLRDGHTH